MSNGKESWDSRLSAMWGAMDGYEPRALVAEMDSLVAELPAGSAIGYFECASAQDSTGHPSAAVPLYRAALEAGLSGPCRRRATIQMASSLRNLGNAAEAAELLFAELRASPDALDDAVRAFLAPVLVDLGRACEAVALCLVALSKHLPRYNRSLERYAGALAVMPPFNQSAP